MTGEITRRGEEGVEYEWIIHGFSSLEDGKLYDSPPFDFGGESWSFVIQFPLGRTGGRNIEFGLWRSVFGPRINVEYTLSLKMPGGSQYRETRVIREFDRCASIPILLEHRRMSEWLSDDRLTVVCRLRLIRQTEADAETDNQISPPPTESTPGTLPLSPNRGPRTPPCILISDSSRTSSSSDTEDDDETPHNTHNAAAQQLGCFICPNENDPVGIKKIPFGQPSGRVENTSSGSTSSCQPMKRQKMSVSSKNCDCGSSSLLQKIKLLRDLKDMFIQKEKCDVVIRVQGREFPAHRNILIARSPVFASAFRSDMKEKASGVIDIEDCDPSSFSDFLCYLYCGVVENLSSENVFSLFTAADKYDVQDLRSECLEFMKKNLSVETFCDTIALALRHSESELIDLTTVFFKKNAPQIIVTVKWQQFLIDNPIQSNELLIKLLASNKN